MHARAHAHAYTHMLHSSHDHMLYCTTAQVKPPGSESVAVLSPQEIEEQLGAKAYSWQSHPIGYPPWATLSRLRIPCLDNNTNST